MTAQEVAEQFTIVWAGKGPLLPPREGGSSLTAITQSVRQHSTNPMIRKRPRVSGGKPRKYSESVRNTVRRLYQEGWQYQAIADKTGVPHGTIHGWLGAVKRMP